jgi:hypothetical protein
MSGGLGPSAAHQKHHMHTMSKQQLSLTLNRLPNHSGKSFIVQHNLGCTAAGLHTAVAAVRKVAVAGLGASKTYRNGFKILKTVMLC